ncbi:MAG: hypothetical protein IPN53_13210 [Comamonadaceae bacterium]|nr:hypothetical protein [Comamonadaceae bacterium]
MTYTATLGIVLVGTFACVSPAWTGALESSPELMRDLDVQLTLLDTDSSPIAGAPVRLVLANAPGWQDAGSGIKLKTDGHGMARWLTPGPVDRRQRKLTTNFFTQLVSPTQETFHFSVAAQLSYLGREWLLVTDVDYFANGTSAQRDGIRLYGVDAKGAFSVPVRRDGNGWHFPGLAWPVNSPGFHVTKLSATPRGTGWSVDWVLRRLPEPIAQ